VAVVDGEALRARADDELLVDGTDGVVGLLDRVRRRQRVARTGQEQRRHGDAPELGAVVAALVDRAEGVVEDPVAVLQQLVAREVGDHVDHDPSLHGAVEVLGVVHDLQRRRVPVAGDRRHHAQHPAMA